MWCGYYPCFLAMDPVRVGFVMWGPDVKGVVWLLPLFLSHGPCTCRVHDLGFGCERCGVAITPVS